MARQPAAPAHALEPDAALDTAASDAEVLHLTPRPELSGFGSMLKYSRRPLARFEAARRVSGRAVAFRVLGRPYLALFDLKAIEQVLVTQHAAFEKDRFTHDLSRVLGSGLLTSEDDTWRRHRKLMAPSFQPNEMVAYGGVMAERARAFLQGHGNGVAFDVHSAMMGLTLDILVRALFGTGLERSGSKRSPNVEHLLGLLMRDYTPPAVAWRLLLPEWVPWPSRRRLARARFELDAILLELIGERRRAHTNEAGPTAPDLLGRLMRACDAEGSLSEAALRDEAMTLFLAGHETTALSLTYGLRLLAQHPPVREALWAELERTLAGRAPTLNDLPNLPYTRAVLDETLRLFPPAWGFGREPREDVVVGDIAIPKGTQVVVCPWVMHRDPQFFAEPERFWPERWLTQPPPPRFAYMPFGAGPRVCIGRHFALAEAMIILAVILQQSEPELEPDRMRPPSADDPALDLMASVTLRPRRPVLLRLRPRQSSTRAAAE